MIFHVFMIFHMFILIQKPNRKRQNNTIYVRSVESMLRNTKNEILKLISEATRYEVFNPTSILQVFKKFKFFYQLSNRVQHKQSLLEPQQQYLDIINITEVCMRPHVFAQNLKIQTHFECLTEM